MRGKVRGALAVAGILSVMAFSRPAAPGGLAGEVGPPPADRLADLYLKILSYDRNLGSRAGDEVRIAVLEPPHDRARTLAIFQALLRRQETTVVLGLRFSAYLVRWEGVESLRDRLRTMRPACLLVSALSPEERLAVSRMTREARILSISLEKEGVDPLSLSAVVERGSVRIYRSDPSLSAEGVELASDFLALTRSSDPAPTPGRLE